MYRELPASRATEMVAVYPEQSVALKAIVTQLALAFWVIGCSPASSDTEVPVQQEWRQLLDGSHFETHNPYEMLPAEQQGGYRIATRCWPDGQGFDCLVLSYDSDGGHASYVTAERRRYAKLVDSDITRTGYSCYASELTALGILYQESIANAAGEQLLKNMHTARPPYETGWSHSFVEKFMRENEITGSGRFFNCLGLKQMLDAGGPATLSTTAVTRDQFFDIPR